MNQSVKKALQLLHLFTEDTPEMTLQDITQKSGMPKPTVYRLLSTLEQDGFLYKTKETEHDSRYQLGLKFLEFGQRVANQLEIRSISLPFMEKLARQINEVIHLVVFHQNQAVYIEKVDSNRALRLHTRIGKSQPLYRGSGPKLLFAFLPSQQRQAIMRRLTRERAIGDVEALQEELESIRERGYAYSVSEQDPDTTGISYPVYDHQQHVTAAIAVSGLSSHFTGDNLLDIKQHTKETAQQISSQLGYR